MIILLQTTHEEQKELISCCFFPNCILRVSRFFFVFDFLLFSCSLPFAFFLPFPLLPFFHRFPFFTLLSLVFLFLGSPSHLRFSPFSLLPCFLFSLCPFSFFPFFFPFAFSLFSLFSRFPFSPRSAFYHFFLFPFFIPLPFLFSFFFFASFF